jgi:DNA-binding NtrC family response regulator
MPTGTILVADDDAAIRTVLNQALSRAGYTVRLTSNASTLWRWVSAGDGDLVITDVVMPDENIFRCPAAHQEDAPGTAGFGYECAKHLHDRNQGIGKGRL